jgi:hypothetical protein
VISGFHYKLYENCALLGCYAVRSSNSLPTFRDNLSVWHNLHISFRDVSFVSIWHVDFIDCFGVYQLIDLFRMLSISSCGISSLLIAVAYRVYRLLLLLLLLTTIELSIGDSRSYTGTDSCHSVTVGLTPVQTKQIRINIHK